MIAAGIAAGILAVLFAIWAAWGMWDAFHP